MQFPDGDIHAWLASDDGLGGLGTGCGFDGQPPPCCAGYVVLRQAADAYPLGSCAPIGGRIALNGGYATVNANGTLTSVANPCPGGGCMQSDGTCAAVGAHVPSGLVTPDGVPTFCVVTADCGCSAPTLQTGILFDDQHGVPLYPPSGAGICQRYSGTSVDASCSWPGKLSTFMAKMPFPGGSQVVTTQAGLRCIAIPATPEITANYNAWMAAMQTLVQQGKKPASTLAGMQAGTLPYGAPVTYLPDAPLDYYGKSAPPGRPEVVNPGHVDGNDGWWTYSGWFWFMGPATKGWLYLINVPYFNVSVTIEQIFPFSTVSGLLEEIGTLIVQAIIAGVNALDNLVCSAPGAIAAAAGGVSTAFLALCGSKLGLCPSGYVKDPATGTCVQQSSTLLYVGLGALAVTALGVSYLALRPKRKAA